VRNMHVWNLDGDTCCSDVVVRVRSQQPTLMRRAAGVGRGLRKGSSVYHDVADARERVDESGLRRNERDHTAFEGS
jgi:hypothetical protein